MLVAIEFYDVLFEFWAVGSSFPSRSKATIACLTEISLTFISSVAIFFDIITFALEAV